MAVQVAHHIGGARHGRLLLLFSIGGAWLAKHEGFSVIRRIQRPGRAGTVPTNELIDGALVFAGGVLLVVPGFVTDARAAAPVPADAAHRARAPLRAPLRPAASAASVPGGPADRRHHRRLRSSPTSSPVSRAGAAAPARRGSRCGTRHRSRAARRAGPAMQSTREIASSSTGGVVVEVDARDASAPRARRRRCGRGARARRRRPPTPRATAAPSVSSASAVPAGTRQ